MPRSVPRAGAGMSLEDHRADWDGTVALVWAGMVLGVSFLVTPVKFLAPSLPRPVALDVARHTFWTFGWVEMALTALLGLSAVAPARQHPLALAPGLIVMAQALWLRPRLGRADAAGRRWRGSAAAVRPARRLPGMRGGQACRAARPGTDGPRGWAR